VRAGQEGPAAGLRFRRHGRRGHLSLLARSAPINVLRGLYLPQIEVADAGTQSREGIG
jgi:hypothetical protein